MNKSQLLIRVCEDCDLALRKLLKSPAALQEVITKVYKTAQQGNIPPGWEKTKSGVVVPLQRMTVRSIKGSPKQVCTCGKKLEYVFEVTLPMWFVDAAGLGSDVHQLGQECVKALNHGLLASNNLLDWLKRELKVLQNQRKHGAL